LLVAWYSHIKTFINTPEPLLMASLTFSLVTCW